MSVTFSRRRFLGVFSLATAGLVLDRWSLLAADALKTCPYALNPVTPFLRDYVAPVGVSQPSILEFDIVAWEKEASKKNKEVELNIGTLRIERKTEDHRIVYRVGRVLDGDRCEMEIFCRPDATETVTNWTARTERPAVAALIGPSLATTGEVSDGKVHWKEGLQERTIAAAAPLVAEASLFFNPRLVTQLAESAAPFIRLESSGVLRTEQRIRPAGSVAVPFPSPSLEAWLLTGAGTVPTHLVRSTNGLPLFSTGLLASYALKNIS